MFAVFVNCGTVLIGSIFGLFFTKKINQEISENIQIAAGIITLVLGFQMAMKYHSIVCVALSLILGGVFGFILDIDGKILVFGNFLEKIFYLRNKKNTNNQIYTENHKENYKNNFAYAFLNSSVFFCVGAMSIVGSFKAGIEKDYSIIFTKSILDGFMAISFASAMGIGTAFSVITIFVYQGALTLLSFFIKPFVSDILIDELTAVGGAIIVMIGINLLGLRKIKTANFLPALVLEVIFILLIPFVKKLINF